jgi:tetratricopeptide (TPR) repeat protein
LAISRDKDGLATQLAAAQWAIDTGKLDLVKSCAATARAIDPEAIQVLLLEGFLARQEGQFAGAVTSFEKALQKSPNSPVVLNQLAICLAEQGTPESLQKAMQYTQLLMNVSGDRNRAAGREALLTSAWVLHLSDRNADAMRQVQGALSAGGVSPDSAYFAAKILSENDKKDAAKQLMSSALESGDRIFPNRANAKALLQELQ